MTDSSAGFAISGTVVKVVHRRTEAQDHGAPRTEEVVGFVEVAWHHGDTPVWFDVKFPGGVPEGIGLGSRVTLTIGEHGITR
jgi:hypothetical protein